jgi:formylmethanofuran--tetrahydromethanopterin N-formyltransferase
VVRSELPASVNAAYEIVIDGLSLESVRQAMKQAIDAACQQPGVRLITAGNYGGKLGPHLLHLHELYADEPGG